MASPTIVVHIICSCRTQLINTNATNGTRYEKLPSLAVFVAYFMALSHSTKAIPISNAPMYADARSPFLGMLLNPSSIIIGIKHRIVEMAKLRNSLTTSLRSLSRTLIIQNDAHTTELSSANVTPQGLLWAKMLKLPCDEMMETPTRLRINAVKSYQCNFCPRKIPESRTRTIGQT